MKNSTVLLFSVLLCGVTACGDEITEAADEKTEIDEDAREMSLDPDGDGVAEGEVSGSKASMNFALADPLPELEEVDQGDDAEFRSFDATDDAAMRDVADALEIIVSSPRSGVAVSLMSDGVLVPSPPTGPGQWSATLNDDRDVFTIEWYNSTSSGLSLKQGVSYDVMYSLDANCCVERIPSTATQFVLR